VNLFSIGKAIRRFSRDEYAATATEYAVMLGLVLCVIIASVTLFGASLDSEYQDVDATLFGS